MLSGSSSMRTSGLQNKARASEILILQPPENSLVGLFCSVVPKPRPAKIAEALLSALSLSISVSLWNTSLSSVFNLSFSASIAFFSSSSSSSSLSCSASRVLILADNSRSFPSKCSRQTSARSTISIAGVSSPCT